VAVAVVAATAVVAAAVAVVKVAAATVAAAVAVAATVAAAAVAVVATAAATDPASARSGQISATAARVAAVSFICRSLSLAVYAALREFALLSWQAVGGDTRATVEHTDRQPSPPTRSGLPRSTAMSLSQRFIRIAGAALVAGLALPLAAHATDVGVSVSVNQPGFYGRVDIGPTPPPVIYPQPVIIVPGPVAVQQRPIYLRVPPGHEKNWAKHCARYRACGQPVYFVRAVPAPPPPHDDRRDGRGHGHDDHDHDRGPGRGHGHGRGHGR
jgi:hypothetical protein